MAMASFPTASFSPCHMASVPVSIFSQHLQIDTEYGPQTQICNVSVKVTLCTPPLQRPASSGGVASQPAAVEEAAARSAGRPHQTPLAAGPEAGAL